MRKIPFAMTLFGLGFLGVLSLWFQPLPMLDGVEMPFPEPILRLLILIQPTVLLFVAVIVGINTAPQTGLRAPVLEAIVDRQPIWPVFRPQIVPSLIIGLIAAVVLSLYGWYQLATVPEIANEAAQVPMVVRLLYGGITEEILLRWGLMSLFVWIGWRFVQGRATLPSPLIVWVSNAVAALLFGVGHLGAAFLVGLTGPLWITLIIGVNALLGLLYGWLYWRKGLEAAMLAHALTHLLALWILMPLITALSSF